MGNKRVYAVKTKTFDDNGHLVCEGIVGIFSTKKKALVAMNKQKEFARKCDATFDEVDWQESQFMYHYEDSLAYYLYELYWYTLDDESLTQYDRVLPELKEE